MLRSSHQRSPHFSCAARVGIGSAAIVACLLSPRTHAHAEEVATAKTKGRIYVDTVYRLKPESDKEKEKMLGGIIAIDPATGDWQIVVENGGAVRLSPDGRKLVFTHYRDGIWRCGSDGHFPFKIFDYRRNWVLRPVWSADGKHLVLTKTEIIKQGSKEVPRAETWQIGADGSYPVRLPIPNTEYVHDWSPDGQWFVTFTTRGSHSGELYLIKTDGTHERRLATGPANWDARFSPDGKKILYIRRSTTRNMVCTIDVDGQNATELATDVDPSVPDGAFWSPDGKRIAVILFDWQRKNGGKVGRNTNPGAHRIEIMDANGANRRRIPLRDAEFLFLRHGDWR